MKHLILNVSVLINTREDTLSIQAIYITDKLFINKLLLNNEIDYILNMDSGWLLL